VQSTWLCFSPHRGLAFDRNWIAPSTVAWFWS
jgi:hypothetical protein